MHVFSTLEQRAEPYKSINDIFEGDQVVLAASSLQNLMHPKNHNRTEAIASKAYIEISAEEQAVAYLNGLLQHNLTITLMAEETKILSKLQAEAQFQGISLLIEAPDVYYMIAILATSRLCNGQGDKSSFIYGILHRNPSDIPDLAKKL